MGFRLVQRNLVDLCSCPNDVSDLAIVGWWEHYSTLDTQPIADHEAYLDLQSAFVLFDLTDDQ